MAGNVSMDESFLVYNYFRPRDRDRDRDRNGDGKCRSNEDCRESWAPFCSEFGYCRSSDRWEHSIEHYKEILLIL